MVLEGRETESRLIKTNKKVFRYDNVLTTWGWTHDVYYDRISDEYIIADFPDKGQQFELSICPEAGPGEIGISDKIYKIKVIYM